MTTASKQIREEIYNRFILAIRRLRRIKMNDEQSFAEVFKFFLGEFYTNKEIIELILENDDAFVIITVVTSLMEASKTWAGFENLFTRQKNGEGDAMDLDTPYGWTYFEPLFPGPFCP